MSNPLEAYVQCTRLVFSVEPSEPSENWEEFHEFENKLNNFYESLICSNCKSLLIDPCAPKKQHISCQHRVCLDCIGKNQLTANCKMCRNFSLFEKSSSTKLLLRLFQELCELIKGSWIYDYIQRRTKPDTGQSERLNLTEIIENGINYGQVSIVLDDSSSSSSSGSSSVPSSGDENSNTSMVRESSPSQTVPYSSSQVLSTFPSISPLAPISPQIVQSPEPQQAPYNTIISEPLQAFPVTVAPQIITQYPVIQQSPVQTQIQLPGTSNVNQQSLLKTPSFVPQVSPMRVKPIQSVKSIMSPIKIQQQAPTIYSVMYTGSGNKITLKRKTPSDEQSESINNSASNMNLIKTDSMSSNFKTSTLQMINNTTMQPSPMITQHQQHIPIVTPIPSTAPSIQQQSSVQQLLQNQANNPNEKRRGCRCGNATAAPGKLTCCGQRCPCYVDSKACIDCKCRGCRNPHFADGQKKLRHFVPDLQTQQQQQQDFLASLQNQSAMLKEVQKSTTLSLMKTEEISLLEQSTTTTTTVIGKNSINNCIISMNSNGQYHIKPRIIMKEPTKTTLSPLIFPTTSATNSSIQILGLYSQVPMTTSTMTVSGDKKMIMVKSEPSPGTVMTFTEAKSHHHLLEPSATNFNTNNLNSNLL